MPETLKPLTKEECDRFDATMRRLENRRYAFAGHHPEGDLFHEGALAIWELLRYVSQLEAEIAQLRAQQGWQPAETAPKDGSRFIAWDPYAGLLWSMGWTTKYERDGEFMPWNERWSGTFTHWMPRPTRPPSGEALAAGTPAPSKHGHDPAFDDLIADGGLPEARAFYEKPAPQTEGE